MIGLLDLGNTRMKWAVLRDHRLSECQGLAYGQGGRAAWVAEWVRNQGLPQRILIASVLGPDFDKRLRDRMAAAPGPVPEFVQARNGPLGIRLAYADPARLGVDRFLGMLGARSLWAATPLVIIDCGTALTFDAMKSDGEHLGGLIVPGISAMRVGLERAAPRLAALAETKEAPLFGCDTAHAVHSGVLRATAAAIDGIAARMSAELGPGVMRVLTGGDAPRLEPFLESRYHYEPDLVLRGLACLAEETPCAPSS